MPVGGGIVIGRSSQRSAPGIYESVRLDATMAAGYTALAAQPHGFMPRILSATFWPRHTR